MAASPAVIGCDDQFEFEFALDLLLDGLGRLRSGSPWIIGCTATSEGKQA